MFPQSIILRWPLIDPVIEVRNGRETTDLLKFDIVKMLSRANERRQQLLALDVFDGAIPRR